LGGSLLALALVLEMGTGFRVTGWLLERFLFGPERRALQREHARRWELFEVWLVDYRKGATTLPFERWLGTLPCSERRRKMARGG